MLTKLDKDVYDGGIRHSIKNHRVPENRDLLNIWMFITAISSSLDRAI
jgi:hypothetical protein